jgi:DNA-binding MarR family transcriptional regulator
MTEPTDLVAAVANQEERGGTPPAVGSREPAVGSREPTVGGGEADERRLRPAELRAWRAFLQAHAVVLRRLEAELGAQAGLSLGHYDVLVQLAHADEHRLRMHELAARLLLSRSGMTRVVDRLEAEGLVQRVTCPSDARGAFAVLTPAGLERLRGATPVHLGGVRRHFAEALAPQELEALGALLERLVARCTDGSAPAEPHDEPVD